MPPLALGKVSQGKITDGYTDQAQYPDALGCKQAANMPVASFIEHDLYPRVFFADAQKRHALGHQALAVVFNACRYTIKRSSIRNSIDLHVVRLVYVMLGISEPRSPYAVIAEQQQTFARLVETTDRS
jgi:hypothetical protein